MAGSRSRVVSPLPAPVIGTSVPILCSWATYALIFAHYGGNVHPSLHERLRENAAMAEAATRSATRKLRNLDTNAVLAMLRQEVRLDTDIPEMREAQMLLVRAGVRHIWQYMQLSTAELTKLLTLEKRMRVVRYAMALKCGALPDTTFTETELRDILERPRNLYAVDGMAERLGLRLASDEARALFAEHHVPDDIRSAIASGLAEARTSSTIRDMITNWPIVEQVLGGAGSNYFVTDRRIADVQQHGTMNKRLERMLAELGLWAPLVFTDEERAARHRTESDRLRLIAFQAQE